MASDQPDRSDHPPPPLPGIVKPQRFRPKFHYELIACGLRGHELIGLDAARLRSDDEIFARDSPDGATRWYRCLRCDSWLPLAAPVDPPRDVPPDRDQIDVPLRGRALRDKIVLRVIAVDRAVHFVVLAFIAAAVLLFAARQPQLRDPLYKILADLEGGFGNAQPGKSKGLIGELRHLLTIQSGTLTKIGLVIAAYAVVEGAEAVGLWYQKRWAEYLTLIATAALMPLEVYEFIHKQSPLKVLTIAINLAVVVYLLFAKRLFGLNGGAAAEHALRERDAGWPAIERATPPGAPPAGAPAPTAPPA